MNMLHRWYVSIEDRPLYGLVTETDSGFVFEHWMLDYQEVAPECPLPMTQGYTCPEYDPDTKRHFIATRRDVKVVEARVDEELPDELFQMEFKEGLYVFDNRSEPGTSYRYVATPQSLLGKPLSRLAPLGIDLPAGQTDNKAALLCFFDVSQRPLRRSASQALRLRAQMHRPLSPQRHRQRSTSKMPSHLPRPLCRVSAIPRQTWRPLPANFILEHQHLRSPPHCLASRLRSPSGGFIQHRRFLRRFRGFRGWRRRCPSCRRGRPARR